MNPNFGKHCVTPVLFSLEPPLFVFFCPSPALALTGISPAESCGLPETHTSSHKEHTTVGIELLNGEQQGHTQNTHQGRVIRHRGEPHVHAGKHTHTVDPVSGDGGRVFSPRTDGVFKCTRTCTQTHTQVCKGDPV